MQRLVTKQCHLLRNPTTQKGKQGLVLFLVMKNEFSFTHKVESKAQEILIQKCICDFPATERAAGSYFLLNLFISVSFCPHTPVQTEHEWIIIFHRKKKWNIMHHPKHLEQWRQRESSAIDTQNILQTQVAVRSNFYLNNTLFRRKENRATCFLWNKVNQIIQTYLAIKNHKDQSVPLCQDHEKLVALQQPWRGKEQEAE